MFKNQKERIKSEEGFTMIELIIVIAIMGILSAILVPSFTEMTRKSRLRSDVSTIQQVDAQISLYMAEQDGKFPGSTDDTPVAMNLAVTELLAGKYIKESDTAGTGTDTGIKLQTTGVKVKFDPTKEHLVLDLSDSKVPAKIKGDKGTAKSLSATDQLWIDMTTAN